MPVGPTDPEIPFDAIQQTTTTWSSNHLVVNGANRWLRVDTNANRWTLSTSADVLIDQDTFNAMKAGTLRGKTVISAGLPYTLDPVPVSGSVWAVLQPA